MPRANLRESGVHGIGMKSDDRKKLMLFGVELHGAGSFVGCCFLNESG